MEQVAWVILAVLFSGLLIALATGGWTGPHGAKAWFKAKFMGQTQ